MDILDTILEDAQLTFLERILLAIITRHPGHWTARQLAEKSAAGLRSVKRAIRYLIDTDYLSLTPEGFRSKFSPPDHQKNNLQDGAILAPLQPSEGAILAPLQPSEGAILAPLQPSQCVGVVHTQPTEGAKMAPLGAKMAPLGAKMAPAAHTSDPDQILRTPEDPDPDLRVSTLDKYQSKGSFPRNQGRKGGSMDNEEFEEKDHDAAGPNSRPVLGTSKQSLGRLPRERTTPPPSGAAFAERPSERWELSGWRTKSRGSWTARDMVGYWAARHREVRGVEDAALFAPGISVGSLGQLVGMVRSYTIAILAGDQNRMVEAMDAVLARAEDLGWPCALRFWFRTSAPDLLPKLLAGKRRYRESPSRADDREGEDRTDAYWFRGKGAGAGG